MGKSEYKTYLDPENECYGCNGIRCGSCLDYDCHDEEKHPSYENLYEKGHLKRDIQKEDDFCKWEKWREIDGVSMYKTTCLQELEEKLVKKYNFCPYCGKKIKVI